MFLVLAPAAGASSGRLVVDPGHPIVGARVVLELKAVAKAPLYVRVTSPTGVHERVRLKQVQPGRWLAAVVFPDDGEWELRVARPRATAKVLVLQSGAALPPFKPAGPGSKASALSGLIGPGVVIGK